MPTGKLRVIQIVKGLDIGGIHGGAELFGLNLARALRNEQVDSRLCVFFQMNTPAERQYLDELARSGVETFFLFPWGGKTSFSAYLSALKKLAAEMKRQPADVLHSHFQVGTLVSILLKLAGRVRFIVRTAHVDREWTRGWHGVLQQALIRFFIFILFPLLVDRECAVSGAAVETLNRRLLTRLTGKRTMLIYNSIPVNKEPSRLVHLPVLTDRYVIGFVGRLTEQKGLVYLLDAVSRITESLPQAQIWIIGDGPLQQSLQSKAEQAGVASSVCFYGKRDDVPDLLRQMDVFVLPSIYEGLPTVILESMANGVPVIATDIPGTREIIHAGENGWLVPPRDPAALADCILQTAQDPVARREMAQAAFESLKEFSIERAAQRYAAVYRELR